MSTSAKIEMDYEEQRKLTSGETECLEEMQEEWIHLYDDNYESNLSVISNRWDYESVFANPIPFLEAVEKLKVVPRYKYIINYLLIKCVLPIGKDNLISFYSYIEDINFDTPEYLSSDEEVNFYSKMKCDNADNMTVMETGELSVLWKILSKRVRELFAQNGYVFSGKKGYSWEKEFCQIITQFNMEELRKLAFGLKMTIQDFNIFLNKVLKRACINLYSRDEVLTYLTLKYGNEHGCNSFFFAYNTLKELYPKKSKLKFDGGDVDSIIDIDGVDTISLQDEIESILDADIALLLEESLPDLEKYFKKIEYINVIMKNDKENRYARFPEKKFKELWDIVYNQVKNRDLDRFKISIQEAKKKAKQESACKKKYEAKMTVEYAVDTEIKLREGMVFKCNTERKSIDGNDVTCFSLKNDTVLPRQREYEQNVQVKAISAESKLEDLKKTAWAKEKKIINLQFVTKKYLEEHSFGIATGDDELRQNIQDISMNGKIRFVHSDKKSNVGYLKIKCRFGTFIPKGTIFYLQIQGIRFEYETIEDIKGKDCPEEEFLVEWEDTEKYVPLGKNRNKELEIIRSGSLLQCDSQGIQKAYFKKRIVIPPLGENKDDCNGDIENNTSLLLQYIYNIDGENTNSVVYYKGFPDYGEDFFLNTEMFKKTRITRNVISSWIGDEERQRNYILTMLFIEYVIKDIGNKTYEIEKTEQDIPTEMVLSKFDYMVAEEMSSCGFQPLSMSNPYDAFLMLLLTCDAPLELFQAIWSDKYTLFNDINGGDKNG